MSLHLDERQRAMLAEMGVRLWLPPAPEADARAQADTPGAVDASESVAARAALARAGGRFDPQSAGAAVGGPTTAAGSPTAVAPSAAVDPGNARPFAQSAPSRHATGQAAAPHGGVGTVPDRADERSPPPRTQVTIVRAPARAGAPQAAAPQHSPATSHALLARPDGVAEMDWDALAATAAGCRACALCTGRTQAVFGVGSRHAEWMVVGEAPGENEDRVGEPFVGQAGKLLDNMLLALGLSRHAGIEPAAGTEADSATAPDSIAGGASGARAGGRSGRKSAAQHGVYIANVIKCRPPANRNPEPAEVAECEPYLARQLQLLAPRIVLAMGRFAVQSLLKTQEPIGRLRGRVHDYRGVPVVVTYHPAYLLRAPAEKAKAWDDLCLARATFLALTPR